MKRPAVVHPVTIRTHTDGHPTSTSFPLSPTEVDHPVRSIAEYILAREKMRWKNEYEYVTGLGSCFLRSSSCTFWSNGSKGFSAPLQGKSKGKNQNTRKILSKAYKQSDQVFKKKKKSQNQFGH